MESIINKIGSFTLIFIAIVYFTSCSSNELSPAMVEKLIKEKFQYPKEMITGVCPTKLYVSNSPQYADKIRSKNNYFDNLEKNGFISYSIDTTTEPAYTIYTAEFTDLSKPWVIGLKEGNVEDIRNEIYDMRTGSVYFKEITEIIEDKRSSMATVRYIERVELNPFGQYLDLAEEIYESEIFNRPNSGWLLFLGKYF